MKQDQYLYPFAIGILLMVAPMWHTWWMRYRMARFRKDIYEIHDQLFDAAATNELPDRSAQIALHHLSAIAQCSNVLTLPRFLVLVVESGQSVGYASGSSDWLCRLIEDAYDRAARRIEQFLFKETLSGRFLIDIPKAERIALARRFVLSAGPATLYEQKIATVGSTRHLPTVGQASPDNEYEKIPVSRI